MVGLCNIAAGRLLGTSILACGSHTDLIARRSRPSPLCVSALPIAAFSHSAGLSDFPPYSTLRRQPNAPAYSTISSEPDAALLSFGLARKDHCCKSSKFERSSRMYVPWISAPRKSLEKRRGGGGKGGGAKSGSSGRCALNASLCYQQGLMYKPSQ